MMNGVKMVYFAECIGPEGPIGAIKIGCSYGHAGRLKQISSGMPFSLELLTAVTGAQVLEKICHIAFKDANISGEYFRKSDKLLNCIEYAKARGRVFHNISDLGENQVPDGATKAFMEFHGVTVEDTCKLLGRSVAQYEKLISKPRFNNRTLIAAAAVVASRRGQWVSWPTDAMKGLLGKKSSVLVEAQNREAA